MELLPSLGEAPATPVLTFPRQLLMFLEEYEAVAEELAY